MNFPQHSLSLAAAQVNRAQASLRTLTATRDTQIRLAARQGLTEREIAALCGLSPSNVHRILSHRPVP